MYKLYIEIEIGDTTVWKLADLGDDKPAMTKQANDIAELKDRQADYSQSLKLPPTHNNCQMFGFSDQLDVITDFPYKRHNCRLFSNDSLIAGIGSYLILTKANKYLEVQILSSNAYFFSMLESKPMSDLDLTSGELNHGYCQRSGYGFFDDYNSSNDKGWCMAAAIYTKGEQISPNNAGGNQYPFVFVKYVIDKILHANNYMPLITNVQLIEMSKKAINISTLKPLISDYDIYANEGIYHGYDDSGKFRVEKTQGTYGLDLYVAEREGGNKWIAPYNCTVDIEFSMTCDNAGALCYIGAYIPTSPDTSSNDGNYIYTTTLGSPKKDDSYSGQVTLKKGDNVRFWFQLFSSPVDTNFTIRIKISNIDVGVIQLGDNIPFAPNLGFDTQLDFFKMFTQLYGLTVQVNNDTKEVFAYTMQKLYDNKSLKKDWSGKVNDNKTDKYFTVRSYGQKNNIKFDDNSTDIVTDKGVFSIMNETLPLDKDLFSIKLEAGFDALSMGASVASIPLEEVKDTVKTFKDGKPHIVEISNGQVTFMSAQVNAKIANHVNAQSFVDNYYARLIEMLNRAKWIDEEFWLTDKDIEEFDHFIPVYIQKYGAFFYVNKIKNYISGQLTKCEIIKL